MWVYQGLPLIARKNNKKKGIVNSNFYEVKSVEEGVVEISTSTAEKCLTFDLNKTSEINSFRDLFLPRYAMTVHKVQGETINEPFSIYEWKQMKADVKFTAATRTTDPKNVHIVS